MRDDENTLNTLTTSLKRLGSLLPAAEKQLLSSFLSIIYAKSMVAQGNIAVLHHELAALNGQGSPSIRLSKGKIRDLCTMSSLTLEAIQNLSEAIGGTELNLSRSRPGSLSCLGKATSKRRSPKSSVSPLPESAKDCDERESK